MRLYRELAGHWTMVDTECVLGAGGEGRVFGLVGDSGLAAKLYDDNGHAERDSKLRAILADAPRRIGAAGHTAIAWPEDLLCREPGGPIVGYVMPRVHQGRVIDDYYNPATRLETCPLFHYEYLLVVARNLASAVRSVHHCGYVVGDMKQTNILVTSHALVTLVDTDSFQVQETQTGTIYRCPVGTPEYAPPELQGLMAPGRLVPEHDLFGLAVLLFQLLMEGSHPFAGVYRGEDEPPPLGERIRRGWFPYGGAQIGGTAAVTAADSRFRQLAPRGCPVTPARRALPFWVLAPELRGLFLRAFVEGRDNPGRRPSADEWQEALDRARAALIRCPANSQHRYGPHLAFCPWCERARSVLHGNDPFPSAAAIGRRTTPRRARPVPNRTTTPRVRRTVPAAARKPGGWAGYVIAALTVPIFLGLLSAQEARQQLPSTYTQFVDPLMVTALEPAPADAAESERWLRAEQHGARRAASGASYSSPAQESLSQNGRFALFMSAPTAASLLDCNAKRVVADVEPSLGAAEIHAMALSPTGNLVAAADLNGVTIWDKKTESTRFRVFTGGLARSLAFSPGSTLLAVACEQGDNLVKVLNAQNGSVIRAFSGNYGEMVASVQFSPDGTRIYAATSGSTDDGAMLYCWSVATGDIVWRRCKRGWDTHFSISPDGKALAVGGWELDLRDAATGDQYDDQLGVGDQVADMDPLCWSPDGRMLAVTCHGGIRLWRCDRGFVSSFELPAPQVVAATFSVDSAQLTTLSRPRGIEDWDVDAKSRLRTIALPGVSASGR